MPIAPSYSVRRIVRPRVARPLLILFLLLNAVQVLYIHNALSRPEPSIETIQPPQRIYIASIHWNNEAILREYWNDAVVALVDVLGPRNVFVSILESGSWDNSKDALRDLDYRLEKQGVLRNITVSDTTHKDEMEKNHNAQGWIQTARGQKELRRIPYLARLRNESLRHLVQLLEKGETFDKVLFLNDVVFTTQDVLKLLNTNNGEYAAACSLDYARPPHYYDTFALRDHDGYEHVMQTWPYFRSGTSRNAMKRHSPVPVSSCWNGIVSMPAAVFGPPTNLHFRGVSDSLAKYHVEGSECCLIHADNPLSASLGVYINPRVRVGYNGPAYDSTHPKGSWVSLWQILIGLWQNRFRRWFTTPSLKELFKKRAVRRWSLEERGNHENGGFCLINEMQVLVENGWAHV
ncbi:polysaccharide export protein [Tothia fuscella]|uniref:Polysaccharide export protein n=1 Tax=Tothia fuscella TaxID=1048955 RepID=A0A9P4NHR2_9PEZI|nr:polysaccharide export protein [Tothia fuscella]